MSALLALAAAASSFAFDCQLEPILALNRDGDSVSANAISFPGVDKEAWRFSLRLDGRNAEIVWPQSPMQVAGRSPVVPTAQGAGVFVSVSGGPCLFTETSCGTLIHYAKQTDGTLRVILTPAALASDSAANTRKPFLVMINGACAPESASK